MHRGLAAHACSMQVQVVGLSEDFMTSTRTGRVTHIIKMMIMGADLVRDPGSMAHLDVLGRPIAKRRILLWIVLPAIGPRNHRCG